MIQIRIHVMSTAIAVLALGAVLPAQAAVKSAIKLHCDTEHKSAATMATRYTHTWDRATFDVVVKVPPTSKLATRARLPVRIAGERVGAVTLAPRSNGYVGGSLAFDSFANKGLADTTSRGFPAAWPGMLPPSRPRLGSRPVVKVGPIACKLAR